MLSPHLFKLRTSLLRDAVKYVPETGFSKTTLARAIKDSKQAEMVDEAVLGTIFDRGFDTALVEHLAKESNTAAFKELESTCSTTAILDAINKNEQAFINNHLLLPSPHSVANKALCAKMEYLHPLVSLWPSAVALEYRAANVPYALITTAEFVDTTAFYMERAENMVKLLEPARQIMKSKSMVNCIPTDNMPQSNREFLESFLHGIPLSSGPHMGASSFDFSWYERRAKLGVAYASVMASFLGDESARFIETRQLAHSLTSSLF